MNRRFGKAAKRRGADSERMAWLLAFVATTVIALLFWFGFRTRPPHEAEKVSASQSACHYVNSWGGVHKLAPWEEMLHVWAKLADPTLMVLPDEELGFSSVRQEKRVLPETPIPEYRFVVTLAKEADLTAIKLTAPSKELPDEMRLRWPVAPPEILEVPKVVPLPKRIVWHRPNGTILPDMPELDVAAIQKAIADNGHPRYPTRVEIQAASPEIPGRVRVRRASGNVGLDMYVVSALRRAIGRYELQDEHLDDVPRPDYLPPPGGTALIEIEWSLLPSELAAEE
jgi:hypothetical protein